MGPAPRVRRRRQGVGVSDAAARTGFGPETVHRLREALAVRPGIEWTGEARRRAGVLVALFDDRGELRVVLGKRSDALRRHPGEVAFPGRGLDPGDVSLHAAALREAWEEVRLDPASVDVLGTLDDMPTAGSGYVIRPYVASIPGADELVPDGIEIERILTPPLSLFADPSRRRDEIRTRDGVSYPVTFFDAGTDVVWGATARILVALVAVVEGREPPPVPAIPVPAD